MKRRVSYKLIPALIGFLICAFFLKGPVSYAAAEREFREVDGVTYVFNVGTDEKVTNTWAEIGGNWYFTDEEGCVLKDQFVTWKNKSYYMGSEGVMQVSFFSSEGELYYADENGVVRTKSGWFEKDSKWYFTNSGGTFRRNMGFWSNGIVYYVGDDGALTGGLHTVSGKLRYFNAQGEAVNNKWIKADGEWYYAEEAGAIAMSKFIGSGSKLYYVGEEGKLEEGIFKLDGKLRYFNKSGTIKSNAGWVQYDGAWYYADSDGSLVTDKVITWRSGKYYAGEDGKLTGGVHTTDDGKLMYFKEDGSAKTSAGWVQYNDKWYYGDKGGVLRQNSALWKDETYYFGEDGTLTGGIYEVNKALRFFDKQGVMRKEAGWIKYQGAWYYSRENGTLYRSAKVDVEGKYYGFGEDGKMLTGLFKLADQTLHYAGANGVIIVDQEVTVDGNRYRADSNGNIYAGSTYADAQQYSSNTQYLIMVDLSEQITVLYKGSQNNWIFQREFTCSTGTSAHPTPTGEYRTTIHDLYFDSFGYRCWYATGFIGGEYLFHSSPYTQTSSPQVCADRTMGTPSSHGCIRMHLEDAKYLYDTVPLGTKVVIRK